MVEGMSGIGMCVFRRSDLCNSRMGVEQRARDEASMRQRPSYWDGSGQVSMQEDDGPS
jgi:hypothetical protein